METLIKGDALLRYSCESYSHVPMKARGGVPYLYTISIGYRCEGSHPYFVRVTFIRQPT